MNSIERHNEVMEKLLAEPPDAIPIADMFEEALGCLEDGIGWLERIDEDYKENPPNDAANDANYLFWDAILEVIKPLNHILAGLIETGKQYAREARSSLLVQELDRAVGRHPAAESDPAVIDAINAVEDALSRVEGGQSKW